MDIYLPYPEWDGKQWVPHWDPYHNEKYGEPCWPEGFDPASLDQPRHQLGEIIAFQETGYSWSKPSVPARLQVQRIRYKGGGRVDSWDMRSIRHTGGLAQYALRRYREGGIEYEGPLQSGPGPRGHWWDANDAQIVAVSR
jgi:hypothetical protein